MANMSILYDIKKHATCNPSNLLAQEYGAHIFNIELVSDADNGNLVKVGDWKALDLFAEDTATTFTGKIVQKMPNGNWLVLVEDPGDSVLVYQTPIAAEDWTNSWRKESNMYNKAGSIVRCYELRKWDRFEVSTEAFDGTPTVGSTISEVSSKKLKIAVI